MPELLTGLGGLLVGAVGMVLILRRSRSVHLRVELDASDERRRKRRGQRPEGDDETWPT
jgi:hypothetical protein